MKKITALILALALMAAVFSGCGSTAGASTPAETSAPETAASEAPVEPSTPETAASETTVEPSASEAAASGTPAATEAPATEGPVTFTDLQGNVVELAAPAKSIATGKANLTQITLILAGSDAVATAGQGVDTSEGSLMNDIFPAIQNLEVLSEGEINMEMLLNINPDLVMIYGNAPETDLSKQLTENGLTVAICGLNNEEELLQTMKLMSDALQGDTAAVCERYERFYRDIMEDVKAKSAAIADEDKPNVAYIRGNGAVCGVNSMPQNWITSAGGKNIGELAGFDSYAAEMTAEEFLNYNPDIVFCESPEALEFLSADDYKNVKAVENGAVYVVPRGLSCSGLANAENPLVWQWAANLIQPEVYDYDAEQTVLDFFKQFYDYELSDAQLETVMYPAGK